MKLAGRFAFAILIAATIAPAAFAAHTHVPTPSTWTLNVKESDFGGGPAMKSDVYVMLTDTEKWLKYSEVSVDDHGKTLKFSWSGVPDGTLQPVTGMPGTKASFKTEDDSGHIVMADGSTVDLWMTYSADKKKATEKMVVKDKDGHEIHQTWVYDRTK